MQNFEKQCPSPTLKKFLESNFDSSASDSDCDSISFDDMQFSEQKSDPVSLKMTSQ